MEEPEVIIPDFSKRKEKSLLPLYILIFVALILIIIFVPIIYNSNVSAEQFTMENVTENVTFTKVVVTGEPEQINFSLYTSNPEAHHNEEVELKGFLIDVLATDNAYDHYLIDDYKNRILLNHIYGKNEDYFTKNVPSERPFKIKGTFKKGFNKQPAIDVSRITVSEVAIINRTENVSYTETRTKQVKKIVSDGGKRMPSILDLLN